MFTKRKHVLGTSYCFMNKHYMSRLDSGYGKVRTYIISFKLLGKSYSIQFQVADF